MSKLEEIVKECIKNHILVVGVDLTKNNTLEYEIDGFSKSGTAKISEDFEGNIVCETRYNTIDYIENFEDLAAVAYDWNKGYSDREPFGWSSSWLPVFQKLGWVEVEEKVIKEIKPKF